MRIGVSGAHGTGKTTLVEALCTRLDGHVAIDEPSVMLEEAGYESELPPAPDDYRAQLEWSLSALSSAGPRVVFDRTPLDALAYLFLRLHTHGITVASIFWGLWLFPFGLLVIRSGFIPRLFGFLLIVAGVAYLASAFATLVVPAIAPLVSRVALPIKMTLLTPRILRF